MSIICYYVRVAPRRLETLTTEDIFPEYPAEPVGLEIVDIDKAYEALAWLASPRKRAEMASMRQARLDSEWSADKQRTSDARLETIPEDAALTALEGRSSLELASIDCGMGPSAFLLPEQVSALSAALSEITEDVLRGQLDFRAMEDNDVQPGWWAEDGEETFRVYLMPALKRLQCFYAVAALENEAVIVVWT